MPLEKFHGTSWPGLGAQVRSAPPPVPHLCPTTHSLSQVALGGFLRGQIDGLGTDGSRHVGVTPGFGAGEGGALATATVGPWSAPAAGKPPAEEKGLPEVPGEQTFLPPILPSPPPLLWSHCAGARERPREGGRPSRNTQHRRVRGLISGCR